MVSNYGIPIFRVNTVQSFYQPLKALSNFVVVDIKHLFFIIFSEKIRPGISSKSSAW